MIPTFVFAIAEQLLGKLSSLVFQELSLAWGVSDDLRKLENTISSVRAVFLDAQERQETSHLLKNWLKKLENAMYKAQDVFEEFEIDALRYKVCDGTTLRKVRREFSLSNRIIFRFKIAHKIKSIREEFDEIAADKNKFGLIERLDERFVVHREMTHSFIRDEDVIGRDEEREAVIRFLMATRDNVSLSVLPIIGMGGMGKTTLAKLVYNDERVVSHFDLRIWVCTPEEFELEKVIKEILKSTVGFDCHNLSIEQLQKCLRKNLEKQKYLLIIDDVWNENHTKWIELRNLLSCGANGSNIIITTRNESVASIMATTDLNIEINGLSNIKCLSLFLKWAFKTSEDATRYPRLVEIAKSIVKKCKGVPLAIRTLGSILYTKTEEREWINVRDNEIWKIEQKEGDVMSSLKLSYYHLPSNLRRCFAFCSMFPKDYRFYNDDLIMYWQANGLLQQVGENKDMEGVGLMYIKQLLSRGFFQEFQDFGSFAMFKMHDLIHDLSLLVAGGDSIHLGSLDARDCFGIGVVRHISFPRDSFREKDIPDWLQKQKKNVHSFAFLDGVGDSKASFVEICISKFRYLRLLYLHDSSSEVLPNSISTLKHLKLLDLSNNRLLKSLPASICELVGLEHLDFQGCLNMEKIPKGIGQLIRLRSLGISTKESYFPENDLRCLTSLRILTITDCPNLMFFMSDDGITCLSALRTLSIQQCESLLSLPVRGFSRLTWLETLLITNCKLLNFDSVEIERGEESLCSLQALLVVGLPKLECLPLCLLPHSANNLRLISIMDCVNLTNLMPESTLEILKSLRTVWIRECPKLKTLPEGMHFLPALYELKIFKCPNMEYLPEGMSFLTSLNELTIRGCAKLVRRCQRKIGEDWHKICHIPNIILNGVKI